MAEIKRHPWFLEFCSSVRAAEELWGQAEGDPVEEARLFKEWLAMAEQDHAVMRVKFCM